VLRFRWETEFKETEIGEIPKDWEVKKATEYIDFIRGIEPGSKLYKNSGKYRFIRVGNLSGERESEVFIDIEVDNEKIANKNDILISFDGTVGIVRRGLEGVFSSGIRKIKIKREKMQELNYEFLYWFFKSTLKYQIFGFSDEKTTLVHASDSIPYLKIFLPPLSEQSRIATVLSYFDDLIEVKKRQNEILEKTAMAIFKSWFIDFEPFKDGEFVYNEELGKEIPKGWAVKRLGEVVKIESGGSAPQKEEYFIGGKNPFVRVKHLTNYPCVEEADFINDEAVKQYNLKLYNEGSIIFQRSGESLSFGRVNILPFNAYIVNHLAVIPNLPSNKLLMEFLFFTLKNILIELIEERSGTALPYIRISDIEKKEILLPPPPILQSFYSLVEPLFQKIILNQKQIMTLRKIRDTLLPLLVFGKLRVEEV